MTRRKHEEEHENHERWLVSYADFITLLFAFFVVMYAISSVNEGKYRVLSDSLVSAFKDPQSSINPIQVGTPQRNQSLPASRLPGAKLPVLAKTDTHSKEEAKRMKKLAKSVVDVLEPMASKGQVRVTQSKRGVAVEINASLLFEPAKAELNPASIATLQALALKLVEVDNLIQVQGFTDNQPIRSSQYPSNWELSAARAGSVVRLMEASGVVAPRLVAIGYGQNRAIDNNSTVEGRARNRRVTIEILADSKDEVAVLD